jgi:hypothetical protein
MDVKDFELASGGVIGREHRTKGANYQDGTYLYQSPDFAIAIVSDGCGSGKHSEVGALVGAAMFGESLRREAAYRLEQVKEHNQVLRINWERVLQDTLSGLNVLAVQIGGNFCQTVENYFLFTLVGSLLIGDYAVFFAIGDGVIIVNDEVHVLDPLPGNKPPYAAYGLLKGSVDWPPDEPLSVKLIKGIRLNDLHNFVLGCDGVCDLMRVAERNIPGLQEAVGPISQFWQDDRYYADNPVLLSRQLLLIGRDWPRKNPTPGLLRDDTTLIVGRRKPTAQTEEADDSHLS